GGGTTPDDGVEPGARVSAVPARAATMRDEENLLGLVLEIPLVDAQTAQVAPHERRIGREKILEHHVRRRRLVVRRGSKHRAGDRGVHAYPYAPRAPVFSRDATRYVDLVKA